MEYSTKIILGKRKVLALLILFISFSSIVNAAAITNAAAGNWSNPNTWPAVSRTGDITSSISSTTVTGGSGSLFLTEVKVGATITKASGGGAGNVIGIVASIQSNTQLTLTSNAAYAYVAVAYKVSGIPLSTDDVTIGGGLAVVVDGGTFYCAS